jgi:penicillin-binding protein 1A
MTRNKGSLPSRILFRTCILIPLFVAIEAPIFFAGGVLGAFAVYSEKLPDIPAMDAYQPKTVSTFYADDGTVIGVFYKQKRFVVELDQIPDHVIKAFLAAEDAEFFEHGGVDWAGMARALLINVKNMQFKQGGSTITMQVVRNFLLTRARKIKRKIREIMLAGRLEKAWGKEKILHVYLNEIYLGDGCYGIEAASRNYFDKPVEHLTIAESALIAGLVASPSVYNPFKSETKARQRRRTVLGRMLRQGFIDTKTYDDALTEELVFRKEIRSPFDLVPDFTEVVRRYIVEKYGEDQLYNQGLKVFTTCRVDYQQKAVEAVKKGVQEIKARHKHFSILRSVAPDKIDEVLEGRSRPALRPNRLYQGVIHRITQRKDSTILHIALSKGMLGRVTIDHRTTDFRRGHVLAVRYEQHIDDIPYFSLDDDPELQAALVLIENRTGYVRALVGGSSQQRFGFNRATQAKRQPGSAFKPIIYAAAMEKKSYSPGTIIIDESIQVNVDEPRDPDSEEMEWWEPKNAGGSFLGPISMRRALELSRNIATIKILMDVKFQPVLDLARKMGIDSSLGRNLSLSLGTSELNLFELTAAYTVFANSGMYIEPVLVKRIEDRHGNVLEDNTEIPAVEEAAIPHPVPREEFKMLIEPTAYGDESQPLDSEFTEESLDSPPADQENPEQEARGEPQGHDSENTEENTTAESDTEHATDQPGEDEEAEPKSDRVVRAALSPETAYIMTDILMGGVRAGTGAGMRKYLKRDDLAGKTGTTNQAADAWYIGFNPDFTTGVWVGFDEKRPLGPREAGGRAALPIWGYAMKEILKDKPEREFSVPPGVTFAEMLTFTGNKQSGFHPTHVREPVYEPFAGHTLIIWPNDARYLRQHLADAGYAGTFSTPHPGSMRGSQYPPGEFDYGTQTDRSWADTSLEQRYMPADENYGGPLDPAATTDYQQAPTTDPAYGDQGSAPGRQTQVGGHAVQPYPTDRNQRDSYGYGRPHQRAAYPQEQQYSAPGRDRPAYPQSGPQYEQDRYGGRPSAPPQDYRSQGYPSDQGSPNHGPAPGNRYDPSHQRNPYYPNGHQVDQRY